jgi:hypothetical protein
VITQFLSGKFDPAYKQTGYAMKRMRAAVSKPKTKKVVVECDWSEASEKRAIAKMRKEEKLKRESLITKAKAQTPVAGVRFNALQKRWVAEMSYKGVRYHFGTFANRDDAVKARKQAEYKIRLGERPL